MGFSGSESEGGRRGAVGLAVSAQFMLSLHYLYMFHLFRRQHLLHRLG